MKTFPKRRKYGAVLMITLAFLLGAAAVIANLARWQFAQGETLQKAALDSQTRDTAIRATRGSIYDSNMNVLAQSATVWNVFLSPAVLKVTPAETATAEQKQKAKEKTERNRRKVAEGLAEILQMDAEEIYQLTLKESGQVYVARKVETDVKYAINEFKNAHSDVSAAIGLEETTKRYYPNGELAATVLGFTGTDGQGLSGLEAQYDSEMNGVNGRVMTITNANGTKIEYQYEQRVEAENGHSLVLTIDSVIQEYLEKHLDEAIEEFEVKGRATGIVMNVNTFEILGMAVRSSYDPNEPFDIADELKAAQIDRLEGDERKAALSAAQNFQWRDPIISDPYEPGSVFKAFTASAALDEGAVTMQSTFECTGVYNVAHAANYHCNNFLVHGVQTLAQTLQNSCNIGFIQIGSRLGASAFSRYYAAFGFTETTGIDLPGETKPIANVHYHAANAMGATELASSSFGQSQKITPIQVATAMAAVVNGGYLGTPHLVSQIIDAEGKIVSNISAGIRRQVISENTSKQMRAALESVVTEGGGKNAAISGHRIGGKTGTAEKLDEKDDKNSRIASFCGFAPADDPEILCLIVVDTPTTTIYGSTVAAPTFKEVMTDVLEYLGVPKTGEKTAEIKQTVVPFVNGNSAEEAKKMISAVGLKASVVGNGKTVIAQFPDPESVLDEKSTVYLFTDEESTKSLTTVPSFLGRSLSEANSLAVESELNINIAGTTGSSDATVDSQSIEAGSKATPGTVITVRFVSKTDT